MVINLKYKWTKVKNILKFVFRAPQPLVLPEPPQPEMITSETTKINYEAACARYDQIISDRKKSHEEISKIMKRVFYALVGTCLFCLITIGGTPDVELLIPNSTVKLPILNYNLNIDVFMSLGPIVIIALFIYLHIFVGQHRLLILYQEGRLPALFNIDSNSAKIASWILFYWLVPITLSEFASKMLPQSKFLLYLANGVAILSLFIHLRRSPGRFFTFVKSIFIFSILFIWINEISTYERHMYLYKADLSEADIGAVNLENAYAAKSNFSGADIKMANLSLGTFSEVDFKNANLWGADLIGATLNGANFTRANLAAADLRDASLSPAAWSHANTLLREANLLEADLRGAFLWEADLTKANLTMSKLTNASLIDTNLDMADLRDVSGLDCRMLQAAANWQKAYRNPNLACGSEIPQKERERRDRP